MKRKRSEEKPASFPKSKGGKRGKVGRNLGDSGYANKKKKEKKKKRKVKQLDPRILTRKQAQLQKRARP